MDIKEQTQKLESPGGPQAMPYGAKKSMLTSSVFSAPSICQLMLTV